MVACCARSQVPVHQTISFSMRYATFALALSLLGRIALQSDLLFYKGGQVVRSGTSHKAPYATWFCCHDDCKAPQSSRQKTSRCSLNITSYVTLPFNTRLFSWLCRRAAAVLLFPPPPIPSAPKGGSPFFAPASRLRPRSSTKDVCLRLARHAQRVCCIHTYQFQSIVTNFVNYRLLLVCFLVRYRLALSDYMLCFVAYSVTDLARYGVPICPLCVER